MNRHPPQPIELIRPDDLLNLRIETENLRFERDAPPDGEAGDAGVWLVVDDATRPGLLRVLFPPQHIAEFAAFESDPRPTVQADQGGIDAAATAANQAREMGKAAQDGADKNDPPLGTLDPHPLPEPGTGLFQARIAAASRLVFRVGADQRIPYTIAGLLDWSQLEPVLHPIAEVGDTAEARAAAPAISKPGADQTALELPYRLLISPDAHARWAHRSQPFGRQGRYELWHTRLLEGDSELDREHTAPLRALWSPDYQPGKERDRQGTASTGLGRSALSDDDRHQLVVLTSAFHGYETDAMVFSPLPAAVPRADGLLALSRGFRFAPTRYIPRPFKASQLMLSPLGGWLKSRGAWTPPRLTQPSRSRIRAAASLHAQLSVLLRADDEPARLRGLVDLADFDFVQAEPVATRFQPEQLDLSEWVHVATQGRDHYVRVVYEGELWPFRHRAAMVKITERKFVQRDNHSVVACLVQRVFVVVREPEKAVFRHDSPLRKVRLTTLVTPNLVEPDFLTGTTRSFWIEVGSKGNKFRFHAVGTDHDGRETDFTIPLIFASITDSLDTSQDSSDKTAKDYIDEAYNGDPDRAADFQGAKVAFTPLGGSDNPLLATRNVYFKADPESRPPLLESAEVVIPSVVELLGKDQAIQIDYDDTGAAPYAQHGYVAGNAAGVFAKLLATLKLDFRADQAGGFATPNQTLTALSRAQGPVAGDIASAIKDSFEPAKYFPASSLPSLFGTFGLDQILEGGSLSSQAPKIATAREADALVTRLMWEPVVKETLSPPSGVVTFKKLKYNNDNQLRIRGETRTPASGTPTSLFTGTLTDFDIVLLDSVTIHFTEFAFTSRNGEKPDIKVALDKDKPLEFSGDLEFVEDLRKAIPPGLFGDGASLEVTAAGIRAGFSIGLPPLEIGVFALKDIALGAALTLPFLDGKPVLDFNVSERANPFQLRVAFFAGGGFFRLQMDTQGMRQIEAALEFGAAFGLSIAVATGEVHAMAGIYFAITRKDLPGGISENNCTLTGYMRLGGRLSVIGIIRLSVEFNLSFTYQEESGKAFGRATVTVMVEVLIVSVSVSLTVERAFGGANDPVFLQTFPEPEHWREYADAFA